MNLSVIVPSYNGAAKIEKILTALAKQSFQDFETIIVIDGSTDNTEEILQRNHFGLKNLRVIRRANGGRSVARNAGVQAANGDLLIFFDDDMRPTPNIVAQHIAHHAALPNTILVGNQIEEQTALHSDIQQYKGYLSRKWGYNLPTDDTGLILHDRPFITAAHFSIDKKLFLDLGGFDEKLTDAEDFDLAVRATQKKIPIYFRLDLIAWHDDFITAQSYVKRNRQYRNAHLQLLSLYPERYGAYYQSNPPTVKGVKKLVYNVFARWWWVEMIDKGYLARILPQKMRYRLYDIIITGLAVYFPQR